MSEPIFVGDLNPADVLAALYNGARAQGLGWLHFTPEPMTRAEAQELLDGQPREEYGSWKGQTYFDYLHGRVMKIAVGGETISPHLYDRDNGAGAASRVIQSLRENALEPATVGIQ